MSSGFSPAKLIDFSMSGKCLEKFSACKDNTLMIGNTLISINIFNHKNGVKLSFLDIINRILRFIIQNLVMFLEKPYFCNVKPTL